MSIRVRALRENDRPEWQPLWAGYLAFYRQTLAPEISDETWRRLLEPQIDMHGLCAVDDEGRLCGIVHFLYHPVTWATTPRCYLEDLYVAESARGLGAGRKLIEAVYAAADERGADQVYWLTEETNETARRLYDHMARKTPFIKYLR